MKITDYNDTRIMSVALRTPCAQRYDSKTQAKRLCLRGFNGGQTLLSVATNTKKTDRNVCSPLHYMPNFGGFSFTVAHTVCATVISINSNNQTNKQ